MKFLAVVLLSFGMSAGAFAHDEGFVPEPKSSMSIGISTGSNDGLSIGYQTDLNRMYQGTLSLGEDASRIGADTLFLMPEVTNSFSLMPYYGIGAVYAERFDGRKIKVEGAEIKVGKEVSQVAVRFPVGLMMNMPSMPLQVGIEAAPTLGVAPRSKATLDTALNLRLAL